MASGTITLSVPSGTHVSGYIKWSASASTAANNYSLVDVSVYLKKTDSYTSWGTFSGKITIGDKSYSFEKYTSLGTSNVLIASKKDVKVSHSPNGSKTVKIGANFSMESGTTISGNYSGSKTVTLDKIQRISSLVSCPNLMIQTDYVLNIDRYSSVFKHKIRFKIDGVEIHESAILNGTKVTFTSSAFDEKMYRALNRSRTKTCTVTLITLYNDNEIGTKDYTMSVTRDNIGVMSVSDTKTGENAVITFKSISDKYRYDLEAKDSTGTITRTIGTISSLEGTHTVLLAADYFKSVFPSNGNKIQVTVTTKCYRVYNSEKVYIGATMEDTFNIELAEAEKKVNLDGSVLNHSIVKNGIEGKTAKGYSTINLIIPPTFATGRYNATVSYYNVTCGGKSFGKYTASDNNITVPISAIPSNKILINAVDSRKNMSTYTYNIAASAYIPYEPTSFKKCKASRENDFDSTAILEVTGSLYLVDGYGAKVQAKYEIIENNTATYAETFPLTLAGESNQVCTFTGTCNLKNKSGAEFDVKKRYAIRITVNNGIEDETTTTTLNAGIAGMYLKKLDDDYRLGINHSPLDGDDVPGVSLKGNLKIIGDEGYNVFQYEKDVGLKLYNQFFLYNATRKSASVLYTDDSGVLNFISDTGTTNVQDAMTVTGKATIGNGLAVTGAATMSNTLGVTGKVTANGGLTVSGASTLNSTLSVAGKLTAKGALAVTGATTMASTLSVTGNTTLSNQLSVGSKILIDGKVVPRTLSAGSRYIELDLGSYIFRMQWGSVTLSPTANTVSSVAITYKDGFFKETPFMTVSAKTGVPGSAVQEVSFYNNSNTGCTIYGYRKNSTSFNITWKAVEIVSE